MSYSAFVSSPNPNTCMARADAVADATCFRRLFNAVMTVIATWLLYAAVRHSGLEFGASPWWRPLCVTVTIGSAFFALWSVTLGDQSSWDRAYEEASDPETDGEG